jgi:hypothetical protein
MLILEGPTPLFLAHSFWPPARFTSERSKRTTSFWSSARMVSATPVHFVLLRLPVARGPEMPAATGLQGLPNGYPERYPEGLEAGFSLINQTCCGESQSRDGRRAVDARRRSES